MPDLGIGEALAAFGGGDLLAGLFGGGEAAAAGAGAGAAEAGLAGTGIADIVGTGAGLAGGETGLAGTLLAGGVPAADIASGAAFGTAGLGALGTAADFLAAQAASGFNAAALTPGFGAAGGGAGVAGAAPGAAQPTAVGGATSVFDTGTGAVPGVTSGGIPSAVTPASIAPGGASASSLAAPAGVTAPLGVDPTAAAGATATGGSAGTAAAGTGASSSIESLVKGATDSLTKNPLGIGLGAAGLGYNILSGQKQSANQKALTADANTATANSTDLTNRGEALQQYLTNGTLPAAYQQQVDQAIADAKTTAISNAAAQGQPTDPTLNTALATTLAKIDASRAGMQTQVATQLFSSGTSLINAGAGAAGLSGNLYQTLVQNDTTSAANTGKAIATLAAALNGKSSANVGGTNIQVSQAA